jgi:hypothetical protein
MHMEIKIRRMTKQEDITGEYYDDVNADDIES